MKRIDLSKYGFVRAPEEDFSDDGTRFTCYKIGDIRVSKASWQDEIFITGRYIGKSGLEYEEYSKLPHYKDMEILNGVNKDRIDESDIIVFRDACIAYQKEMEQAEKEIVYPTETEIADVRKQVRLARMKEFEEVKNKITMNIDKVFQLGSSTVSRIQTHYNSLNKNAHPNGSDIEYAKNIVGSRYSRSMMLDSFLERELRPSFDYRVLVRLLA